MELVASSSQIFTRRRSRQRVRNMVAALTALTALNSAMLVSQSAIAQDDAFDRLVEPTGLVTDEIGTEGDFIYNVVGSTLQFVFIREGREATIRFLCHDDRLDCPSNATATHKLMASQASRGDLSFRSEDGELVLRIVTTGGATIFGGASFVPKVVSSGGLPVTPAS